MKTMKKKLAVAVTVALLAFPLNTALTMADSTVPTTTTSATTTTDTTVSASPALRAEVAVAAYEAGSLTTLAKVATAEGLKAAADRAVAEVGDGAVKTAFELRVTNRAVAIATAKTTLKAEVAVAAYEAGSLTTLAKVATAEGLKAAANTAVAAVGDGAAKTAFELRITNRAAAIATAKTIVTPVVDSNGNTVTSANWFTDLIGKLQLALAFDPARKAELNERHALAKLAEAHKLMNDGKSEAAEICLNQYTDKIAKAQAFLAEVKDPTSETAKTLEKALANVDSNNVQVLSNLVDKLPPQAANKLALNVVRSMEKVVAKIQKEEAKVALETTSVTTPVVTPVAESKILEKQAKMALANFKESLNQKGKIHFEDQDRDQDQDRVQVQDNKDKNVVEQCEPEQEKLEMEKKSQMVTQIHTPQAQSITKSTPTHLTVVPVKTQKAPTMVSPSKNDREDQNEQEVRGNDKSGDEQDNHRNGK